MSDGGQTRGVFDVRYVSVTTRHEKLILPGRCFNDLRLFFKGGVIVAVPTPGHQLNPVVCYGARLGIHPHLIADPADPTDPSAQNQAFASLLHDVREVFAKRKRDCTLLVREFGRSTECAG